MSPHGATNPTGATAPFPAWIRGQIETLLKQVVAPEGNSAWIGVASLHGLRGKPENGLFRAGGALAPFAGCDETTAFVWEPTNEDFSPELWIDPYQPDWRQKYEIFARTYWPGAQLRDVDVHVDHVFPKAPAKLGDLSHVRLLAIPGKANVSAGTFEKSMTNRSRKLGPRSKPTRLATLYAVAKACGYVGFAGVDSGGDSRRAIAARIMDHLSRMGISPEATSNLDLYLLEETLADLR